MAVSMEELREVAHQHSLFFDKLVDMIPAKFYLPSDGPQDIWSSGMSKAARAARKTLTRENLKLAKRKRLDPEEFISTSQLVQQQKNVEGGAEEAPPLAKRDGADRAVTREQLVERLHKRLEMLRAKRHADEVAAAAQKARNWQTQVKEESKKRKPVGGPLERHAVPAPPAKRPKTEAETSGPASAAKQDGQPMNLEFGRVKMGLDIPGDQGQKKRPKPSKEQLLTKATELQKQMQDPSKGQDVASSHSWAAAASRASGDKVKDDPRLLKRSLKKEKHQKQKSTQKWQERKDKERKQFLEKQQKRRDHIASRIDAKEDRSIAKREKKLLRPGFEGRREGFINS